MFSNQSLGDILSALCLTGLMSMDISYRIPDFSRVLSAQIFNLDSQTDVTFVTRDGATVNTHKLPIFFAFPVLKSLSR